MAQEGQNSSGKTRSREGGVKKRVMNHWQEDLMFGYQFLNGCNPVLIRRCTKLPEKLPVTTEMVECSLERQLTLEEEVEVGPRWLG
uniref:Lipoxygenase domain-containing protein n=1 Tax=Equus asinus TaxID=9793 RepID=A0A9L0ISQ1_EQUAS